MKILDVTGQPFNDTTIQKYQFHNYHPYIPGNIGYNDKVRIPIQEFDSFTLPCNRSVDIVRKVEGIPNKFGFRNLKLLLVLELLNLKQE